MVGFPPLTHDRIPAFRLGYSTCGGLYLLFIFIHIREITSEILPHSSETQKLYWLKCSLVVTGFLVLCKRGITGPDSSDA